MNSRRIINKNYSFINRICVVLISTLIAVCICNAQDLVSYDEPCVYVNEEKLFRAFFLTFGTDTTCWILNQNKTTLIKVYVDSLCRVKDVVFVNSTRAKQNINMQNQLLNTMRINDITFQKCFETPPLFTDDSAERLQRIKEEYTTYLVDHYHNRIPISIFVSKSDFVKWVNLKKESTSVGVPVVGDVKAGYEQSFITKGYGVAKNIEEPHVSLDVDVTKVNIGAKCILGVEGELNYDWTSENTLVAIWNKFKNMFTTSEK